MAYEPERREVVEEDEVVEEGAAPGERKEYVEEPGTPEERREVVEESREPGDRRLAEERRGGVEAPRTTRRVERARYVDDPVAYRRFQLTRATQIIYFLFGLLEALIAIRVVLKLLAANAQNGFAAFIYGVTDPFVLPFQGLFITPQVAGAVLELGSIVAIFIYMLIAYALARLIWLLFDRPTTGARTY